MRAVTDIAPGSLTGGPLDARLKSISPEITFVVSSPGAPNSQEPQPGDPSLAMQTSARVGTLSRWPAMSARRAPPSASLPTACCPRDLRCEPLTPNVTRASGALV